jgi:glycosyltransferase involved in cell wall biosynthesis
MTGDLRQSIDRGQEAWRASHRLQQRGLPEVVELGVSGLVAEADARDLADALFKTLSSSFDREKIIERVAKRINAGDIINSFLDLLKKSHKINVLTVIC